MLKEKIIKHKNKIIEHKNRIMKNKDNYGKWYKITDYILFFFVFAFIGWVWEVCLILVQTGKLVNRGVLLGPWLPIYGTGGVLILLILRKIFNKPVLTFVLTTVLCTVVEYFTSWYLEITKGVRWWDYSGYFLNINGRVCLEGALVFGLGGCAVIYLIAPKLSKLFSKIPNKVIVPLCIVLVCGFIVDLIHSKNHPNMGEGITASRTSIEICYNELKR